MKYLDINNILNTNESRWKMISKKVNSELNKQLNIEFDSAYLYVSMSKYCTKFGFERFKARLLERACKHSSRAKHIYDYIIGNFGKIEIAVQDNSKMTWKNKTELLKDVINTKEINQKNYRYLLNLTSELSDSKTFEFVKILNNSLENPIYCKPQEVSNS